MMVKTVHRKTTAMDITLRLATVADVPEILRLYYESGIDDEYGFETVGSVPAEALFQQLQTYPNYRLWMATLTDHPRPVGTISLLVMDSLVHNGTPAGIVEGVAVDPAFQGRGIGKQMVHFVRDQCRAAGCYKMSLSTNLKRKQAHAFYEALGMEKRGYSFSIDLPMDDGEIGA